MKFSFAKIINYVVCFTISLILIQNSCGFVHAANLPSKTLVMNNNFGVSIPIIMYHNLSIDEEKLGTWIISPTEMENDFIYLKENNYNPIFLWEIVNFVENGVPLPENPIVLSFDDGDSSMCRYLLPLLEEYEMKVVIAIIGFVTDDYSKMNNPKIEYYPHITWNQVNSLIDTGFVEIQNHSYDMHKGKGAVAKTGESSADYKARATADITKLQSRITEMTNTTPTFFVYPYGAVSSNAKELVKELGFYGTLSCVEFVSFVETEQDLFDMGRILRPHGVSSREFFERIEGERRKADERYKKVLVNRGEEEVFE